MRDIPSILNRQNEELINRSILYLLYVRDGETGVEIRDRKQPEQTQISCQTSFTGLHSSINFCLVTLESQQASLAA